MNYEKELLTRLIEKYEKSKAFVTGIFSKRIALTVAQERWLQEPMEQPEEKQLFFHALEQLRQSGLIDYSWEKYEEGNLVEKIWLIPEEEAIRDSYARLGRIPKKDKAGELGKRINAERQKLEPESPLFHFFTAYLAELDKKQQICRFFTEDQKQNEDILRCLMYLEQNRQEQMERVMSVTLYGDSKYFAQKVRSKVLSILRHMKKEEGDDILEDEELLREKGIVRWPEILEFTGNLTVCLKDGDTIDYRTQKFGAYINAETVNQVSIVQAQGIRRVLFIENKANYLWYLTHQKRDDELVVFHGGCYSPVKGNWFCKLYDGCEAQKAQTRYFHWSDIDLGGFRIFHRLQKNIIPTLEPYGMDVETLEHYRQDAMPNTSSSYLKKLQALRQDPAYSVFHGVLSMMLKEKIRLEQEQLIAECTA